SGFGFGRDCNGFTDYRHFNQNPCNSILSLYLSAFHFFVVTLQKQRAVFEQYNVFSPAMIDGIIRKLRSYEDKTLRADLEGKPEEMLELVHKYFHCG
ncbi:hypothetical protein ACMSD4_24165, partial [Bacteroides thetaiotaomicron]